MKNLILSLSLCLYLPLIALHIVLILLTGFFFCIFLHAYCKAMLSVSFHVDLLDAAVCLCIINIYFMYLKKNALLLLVRVKQLQQQQI